VDQNYFRGTRSELAALLGGGGDDVGHVDSISDAAAAQIADQIWFRTKPVGYDPAKGAVVTSDFNFNDHVFWLALYERMDSERDARMIAMLQLIQDLLPQVAGGDLSKEEFERIIREGMQASAETTAAKTAELVVAQTNAKIQGLVTEALEKVQAADNANEVQQLLQRIGELARVEPPEDASVANQDGLRGGAAAPEGVGGGPAVDSSEKEIG
jgi:hypothetical protein